jgi:two-component sensor histidine kinase
MARLPDWLVAAERRWDRVRWWHAQLIALGLVAVACALRVVSAHLGMPLAFVTFYPAIGLATVLGGVSAALSTLVLSALVASYFWLEPKGSFALTPESMMALAAFSISGGLIVLLVWVLRQGIIAARAAEARATLVAREMRHRVDNVLAVVASIARQTARNADDFEDFRETFPPRIAALARAQDVALGAEAGVATLGALIRAALAPFAQHRLHIEGPEIEVPSDLVSTFGLAIYELATNAIKYGALSVPDGVVDIRWRRDGDRTVLRWTERGGPPPTPPACPGFGTQLLEAAFGPGRVELDFPPVGFRATIELLAPGNDADRAPPSGAPPGSLAQSPL